MASPTFDLTGSLTAMYMSVFGGEPYVSWAKQQMERLDGVADFWIIVHDGCLDDVQTPDYKIRDASPANVVSHMQTGAMKAIQHGAGLMFLVSVDDWFYPDVISQMFAEARKGYDVVYTSYEAFNMQGVQLEPNVHRKPGVPFLDPKDFPKEWKHNTFPFYFPQEEKETYSVPFPECAVYRTQMFREFPLDCTVDREFIGEWLRRMMRAGRYPTASAVQGGFWYNHHNHQLTHKARGDSRGFRL